MPKIPGPERTTFRVKVTDEDIDRAHRGNSYRCVVAQSLARSIPDATKIEVDLQTVRFTRATTGERLVYLTPNITAGYVVAFDAGDPIHPFTFTLSRPIRTIRRVLTPAGKATQAAKMRAHRAKTKARASKKKAPAGSDPAAAAAAVKEEYQGAAMTETVEGGVAPPRPRVFKTGRRTYGSRILRVNRYLADTDAVGDQA